jgi:hypothetical protein
MLVLSVVQSDLVTGANLLPPETVVMIVTAVNFVLRFLTSAPLTASKT